MYHFIVNPETNRKVNIFGNIGQKILQKYINQIGGHNGPCSVNAKTGRCKKSKKWDHDKCKISPKGRCQNITKKSAQKTPHLQEPVSVVEKKQEPLKDDTLTKVNLNESIKIGETKIDTNSYEYFRIHNPKKLNAAWRNARLNSVLFNGPVNGLSQYGDVEYFESILINELGENWSKRVLSTEDSLDDSDKISRLGIPGRQGTVIRLDMPHKNYAVKVTAPGVSCGDGATGGMGFLKQARMQEIAATYNVTGHVYAVFCGHKKFPSFMVMDLMGKRLVDVYGRKTGVLRMSQFHQEQAWELYKILDEKVGIIHNDTNCLNMMVDKHNNIKLIDFDRSAVIEHKHLKKWGSFPNLAIGGMIGWRTVGCGKYGIITDHYKQKVTDFFSNPINNNGTTKFRKRM